MKGTGVKLHPEHHVPTRGPETFVIALKLTGEKTNSMKVVCQVEQKEHNSLLSRVWLWVDGGFMDLGLSLVIHEPESGQTCSLS